MRRPSGALWSHRDFLKLWTGQTISEFGSQVSQLAIPAVAVLTLKATPFQVAALAILLVADGQRGIRRAGAVQTERAAR